MKLTSLLILAACAFFTQPQEASAMRFIRASISFEGNVILEGSWSDDGYTDADGVWEYLKQIKFKPTEAFQALGVAPTAQQTVLSDDRKGVALSRTKLKVDIAYGGASNFRKLTLTRVPKDRWGSEWKLNPKEIDGMFAYRLISRREASKLRTPSKLKP